MHKTNTLLNHLLNQTLTFQNLHLLCVLQNLYVTIQVFKIMVLDCEVKLCMIVLSLFTCMF